MAVILVLARGYSLPVPSQWGEANEGNVKQLVRFVGQEGESAIVKPRQGAADGKVCTAETGSGTVDECGGSPAAACGPNGERGFPHKSLTLSCRGSAKRFIRAVIESDFFLGAVTMLSEAEKLIAEDRCDLGRWGIHTTAQGAVKSSTDTALRVLSRQV